MPAQLAASVGSALVSSSSSLQSLPSSSESTSASLIRLTRTSKDTIATVCLLCARSVSHILFTIHSTIAAPRPVCARVGRFSDECDDPSLYYLLHTLLRLPPRIYPVLRASNAYCFERLNRVTRSASPPCNGSLTAKSGRWDGFRLHVTFSCRSTLHRQLPLSLLPPSSCPAHSHGRNQRSAGRGYKPCAGLRALQFLESAPRL